MDHHQRRQHYQPKITIYHWLGSPFCPPEVVQESHVREPPLRTATTTRPYQGGRTLSADAKEECSVCKEDFELGEKVTQLPCLHIFHEACLVPWLKMVCELGCARRTSGARGPGRFAQCRNGRLLFWQGGTMVHYRELGATHTTQALHRVCRGPRGTGTPVDSIRLDGSPP